MEIWSRRASTAKDSNGGTKKNHPETMLAIPTKRAKLSLVARPATRRAGINPTNGIPSACHPKTARNAKAMTNNAPLSIKPSHGFCNRSRRKKNMIVIVPAQMVFYGQRDDTSIKYVKECNPDILHKPTAARPKYRLAQNGISRQNFH